MTPIDRHPSGRHFLQIRGPTNVPDRVLRAIDRPTIDHRGPAFAQLCKAVIAGLKRSRRRATSSSIRRREPALGRRRSSTRCRRATGC